MRFTDLSVTRSFGRFACRSPIVKKRQHAELPSAPSGQLMTQILDLQCLRYVPVIHHIVRSSKSTISRIGFISSPQQAALLFKFA